MKKSRVASNALNNPKAGYSQLARLEPTAFERRSRQLQLTALEQLSKVLEAKQEIDPHTKKADTSPANRKMRTNPAASIAALLNSCNSLNS